MCRSQHWGISLAKLVAWSVSHCHFRSTRMWLLLEIVSHVQWKMSVSPWAGGTSVGGCGGSVACLVGGGGEPYPPPIGDGPLPPVIVPVFAASITINNMLTARCTCVSSLLNCSCHAALIVGAIPSVPISCSMCGRFFGGDLSLLGMCVSLSVPLWPSSTSSLVLSSKDDTIGPFSGCLIRSSVRPTSKVVVAL